MGQGDTVAPGARREAAGNRHRAFDAHIGHVRILAGGRDFAKDKERPVGFDLHRHRGIADVAVAQPGGDLGGEFGRSPPARRHRADQRHGDRAAGIDRIGIGEAFLAIDHDPQFVAGIEPVDGIMGRRHRRGGIDHRDGCVSAAAARRRSSRAARRWRHRNRRPAGAMPGAARRWRVRLTIGHGIEIALRLRRRDGTGRVHAARQSERGHGGNDRQSKRVHNPHWSHPS